MRGFKINFVRSIIAVMVLFTVCESINPIQNNISSVLDNLLAGYDRRLRPNIGGAPVDVEISMYIISVNAVSDDNLDFTMDFYFRAFWRDPRLAFEKKPGMEVLTFDASKSIWLPDLFFLQDKRESFQHTITTKNEFVKIHHSGNVTRSLRLSVTASCPMAFQHFPLDLQICQLDIESYGHNANGIKLLWKEPIMLSNESLLLTHELTAHKETAETITVSSGTYSRLVAEFHFKRLTGFYWRQVYLPCTFLVIISWISFWLKRGSNERLTVCALSLLILNIGCQLLGVCMTFSFFALAESLFVSKRDAEDKCGASRLDKFSRIAFPIAFILFNALYWTVY